MRPFRSNGDPKQFLVEGSIGDQRIRILIDTGATISFISRSIVKVLTPKLTVKSSELSIVLGNGDSQDSDHYVDAEMRLKHQPFESRLQLLDLPTTFDVIVGMDWLTRYDGRVNARARTLEVTTAMGMRVIVAGFGAISSGLPKRSDHRDLNHVAENLCFLQSAHERGSARGGGSKHHTFWGHDTSEIAVRIGPEFQKECAKHRESHDALMLLNVSEMVSKVRRVASP